MKIENMHLRTAMPGDPGFPTGSGSGNNNGGSFDTRPTMSGTSPWQIGDTTPANASAAPFQYPVGSPASQVQYLFTKALQISPRGEIRVDDASQPLQAVVEIGLQPTHGPVIDATNRNVTALQVTGISGNVKIYRR